MDGFNKYSNMIRKVAWKITKAKGLEFADLEAQGYLIYCVALEKFDPSKAGFSTYLFIQLEGRLNDYADSLMRVANRENGVLESWDDDVGPTVDAFLESVESVDYQLENDFISFAEKRLDAESFGVLEFLISFEWLSYRRKPTVTDVMRKFGYKRDYAKKLWNNCRNFWREVA